MTDYEDIVETAHEALIDTFWQESCTNSQCSNNIVEVTRNDDEDELLSFLHMKSSSRNEFVLAVTTFKKCNRFICPAEF